MLVLLPLEDELPNEFDRLDPSDVARWPSRLVATACTHKTGQPCPLSGKPDIEADIAE